MLVYPYPYGRYVDLVEREQAQESGAVGMGLASVRNPTVPVRVPTFPTTACGGMRAVGAIPCGGLLPTINPHVENLFRYISRNCQCLLFILFLFFFVNWILLCI